MLEIKYLRLYSTLVKIDVLIATNWKNDIPLRGFVLGLWPLLERTTCRDLGYGFLPCRCLPNTAKKIRDEQRKLARTRNLSDAEMESVDELQLNCETSL